MESEIWLVELKFSFISMKSVKNNRGQETKIQVRNDVPSHYVAVARLNENGKIVNKKRVINSIKRDTDYKNIDADKCSLTVIKRIKKLRQ